MDAPGSVIGAFRGTIVTLGGGGFSMSETGESATDDWLLDLAGRRVAAAQPHSPALPRVCFVPTASGDSRDYIERFEAAFTGRAQTHVLSLFGQSPWGYREPEMLAEMDLVYVGGGSTVNLLALWRTHGVDDVLQRAAASGTILAGISAGANCWFEASSTDSFGPLAPLRDGLGFLPGSACPHHHGEEGRAETFRTWIADGTLPGPGFGLDDGAAAVFTDGALASVVTEDPLARVHLVEGETETPLESILLA
ncbi:MULTISPECIES: peptidase E [Brevibacterium]|uniref:Peptidase E n=1 Tax=Brevibacterium casei S18 TaxID=1229781 RepID=K9AWJ6_9MICO|nr:peptidase E [Brevibacterium casei]EKU46892.1 peptidase E [Brevibacterium casei S18]